MQAEDSQADVALQRPFSLSNDLALGQWSEPAVDNITEQLPPSEAAAMQMEDPQTTEVLQPALSQRSDQTLGQQVWDINMPEFDLHMSDFLLGTSDLLDDSSLIGARRSPPFDFNGSTLYLSSTNIPGVQDSFAPQSLETMTLSPFYQLSDLNIYNWAWKFDHTCSQMHRMTANAPMTMQPYLSLIQGVLQDAKSSWYMRAPSLPTLSQVLGRLQSLLPEGLPSDSTSSSRNYNGSAISISFDMISADAILYSIANNFAGLQGIPPGSLFRLFSSQQSLTLRLYDYLRDCPPFLSKAFADNVFRAAVEAGDAKAVRQIAKITKGRSNEIDPNAATCELGGRRLAPLFFAFFVGNVTLASILVELGAKVHQSLQLEPGSNMPRRLGKEIRSALQWRHSVHSEQNFASDSDSALVAILAGEGGAKITLSTVKMVIGRHLQMVAALLDHLAPCSHEDVLQELGSWSKSYNFIPSVEVLKRWVKMCKAEKCFRCLQPTDAGSRGGLRPLERIVRCAASYGNLETWAFLCNTIKVSHLKFSSQAGRQYSAAKNLLEGYGAVIESSDSVSSFLPRQPTFIEAIEQLEDADSHEREAKLRTLVRTALETNDIRGLTMILQAKMPLNVAVVPTTLRICLDLNQKNLALEALLTLRDPFNTLIGNFNAMQAHELEEFFIPLLDAGCTISSRDFMKIASSGEVILVRMLLESGSFIQGSDSAALLRPVIENGHIDMLELLLLNNCKQLIHRNNAYGQTPLAHAARQGNRQMVDMLLFYGFDPADDWAFHFALKEHPHLLDTLLEAFRNRYPSNHIGFGAMALISAIKSNRMDILQKLVNAGMSPHSYDPENFIDIRPLYAAITHPGCNNLEAIRVLMEAGAIANDIIALETTGDESITRLPRLTPLLSAIDSQNEDAVRFLLEKGADVNGAGVRGLNRTPLQRACEIGNYKVVRLLLLHGAEVNAKPCIRAGGTALQFAAATGSIAIAKLLIARGANVNDSTSLVNGRTAIEAAAEHGRIDMMKVLWDATGGSGFLTKDVESAMKIATEQRHGACVEYLKFLNGISAQQHPAQEMATTHCNLDGAGTW